ncbi:phasin family protein [Rubrimonas cliftonensis]|uniref:Phasin protein n=1 Tax=Rubrimonas cliftonensis TaxID=89524 RepID=A0A1H4CDP7_9RHOB|nr:phasin family protein [Rubrimonas cliftonensis]SEA58506.1 Phasin protein [Rubrimonas cliftonensis]
MTRHDAGPTAGTRHAAQQAPFDPAAMLEPSRRAMEAATEAHARMLRQMAEFGGEMLRFAGRRIEQDRFAAQKLAECRTPQDALHAYGDFLRDATRDYSEEMGRLGDICGAQTREAMALAAAFSPGLRRPPQAAGSDRAAPVGGA